MHLWEQIDGENLYGEYKFVPYVWIKNLEKKAKTFSITGEAVVKKEFENYFEYIKYCRSREKLYENKMKPEVQFLVDKYFKFNDEEFQAPKLKIFYWDIEVYKNTAGFPNIEEATDPIVLISVMSSINGRIITWGCHDYSDNTDDIYIKCKDEKTLLTNFFNFMNKADYDILTGWNISRFDLPFLYNRTKNVFGDTKMFNKLSPINITSSWTSKTGYKNYDISGVTYLDYLDVYKQYKIDERPESYSLQYISSFELGEGKLDYSKIADSFATLYQKDFDTAVKYNKIDVKRVSDLENKLGFINVIQTVSLFSRCPMKYCMSQTSVIEGTVLLYLRRRGKCAPSLVGGKKEEFEAAIVKEPQVGFKRWVVDFDVTSQYPTAMITLNMSNETYLFKIIKMEEKDIVNYIINRKFPPFECRDFHEKEKIKTIDKKELSNFNVALQKGLLSIAPNGVVFKTSPVGVIAGMEHHLFNERKVLKGKMLKYQAIDDKPNSIKLENLQMAVKLVLNAVYGAFSVPYSRYFNLDIAEAITACGRHILTRGMEYVNHLINSCDPILLEGIGKLGKIKIPENDSDFILYGDTDSLYFSIENIVLNFLEDSNDWLLLSNREKLQICKKVSLIIQHKVNSRMFREVQQNDFNSIVRNFKIFFKQETIAKSAIFIAKKKYSLYVIDQEGITKDSIQTKGLETIQSSCPSAIKSHLKAIIKKVLDGEDREELDQYIEECTEQLRKAAPEEIALNIGINNIVKYLENGAIKKGTPYHIKGAINHNRLLNELELTHIQPVHSGEKAKTVYVKPNKWAFETFSFYLWHSEFTKAGIDIDYEKMIEKAFLNKINIFLNPLKNIEDDE